MTSISADITKMADELERQINTLSGRLLIVTWQYMELKSSDPERENRRIDSITAIDEELRARSLHDRYSIIYRGSGDDKATNHFADYEAITFLGEWKCGTANVKLVNRNLGINSSEMDHRLAAMVQTICRIRIRRHDGEQIKIFYSSDISQELIYRLFDHFVKSSDEGVEISGVPIYTPSPRTTPFIDMVTALCNYDDRVFRAIQRLSPYTLSIPFADILRLIPKRERRRRAYDRLSELLKSEYNVELKIT